MLWATLLTLIALCLLGFGLQSAGTVIHVLMVVVGLVLFSNLVSESRRTLSRMLTESNHQGEDRPLHDAARNDTGDETTSSKVDAA